MELSTFLSPILTPASNRSHSSYLERRGQQTESLGPQNNGEGGEVVTLLSLPLVAHHSLWL